MSAFRDLAYIRDFVCAKIGQTDQNSKNICDDFIRARYRMIYDSFEWLDSQLTVSVGLDDGANAITMPEGMDRVIAIRSNGDTFLDPVNANLLMQTDPTIFERSGLPQVYYENFDTTEGRQIIVYPTPSEVVTLFIAGKRTLPELTDGADFPIIRNIDNVLIAYAFGDMLERLKQFEKAKLKFDEAGAMLQAAQALETSQTNKPRIAKQLTVSGNSLAELTNAVCDRTGMWGLDQINSIKESLRRQYQRICDACNWSELTVIARVNSDGSEIVLPPYMDRVIAIRADANLGALVPVEAGLYFGIAPSIFEQTGSAVGFGYLTSAGVAALPPTREKLSFSSAWATDKQKVFVMGEVRGSEVSETVTLNGNVPVQTLNEYDTPLTVAKEITKGDVTVTGGTTGTVLVRLLASELERKHMRIWMQPTPVATVCLVLGKRRIKPLVQNEDTPMLRDIQGVLIAASSADMFAKAGNDKAATDARSEASNALKVMVDLEVGQGAYSARVVPDIEPSDCYDFGYSGWLTKC